MADDSVKKLLIKLGISTADWKTAVNDIKAKLNEVNTQARKDAEQMKATQKEQLDLTKQQIAEQKKVTAEARTMTAVDQAKAAWEKRNQEALRTKLQQRILETAELKKQQVEQAGAVKMEQEQLRLAQQKLRLTQQQIALQERQIKAQAPKARAGEGGGGGLFGTLAGALGGGMLGSVAAGASVGTVIGAEAVKLIDMASEKMHSLTEAIIEATGPAVQLREQFEKLTARAGVGPEEYLNKLRVATRGLADDTALYRIANNYMQQGLKVSTDDIARLIKATVDLARAQGKDATQAMTALERASKTGRTNILAMVTGLTRQELALKGVSQAVDATTRNTMQFNQVLAALEAREKAIGTPLTTLPELFEQWRIRQKNLIDDIAIAISKSEGFRNAVKTLSDLIVQSIPRLTAFAEWIGSKIGDAFILVNPIIKLVTSSLHLFMSAVDEAITLIPGFSKALGKLTDISFREWVASAGIAFRTLAEYIQEAADKTEYGAKILNAVIHANLDEAKRLYTELQATIAADRADYAKDVIELAMFGQSKGNAPTKPAGKQQDINQNVAASKMLQKLELEIAQQTSKLKYEMTMERLKAEEDATKEAYEAGLITLQQELDRERSIFTREHNAKLSEIEEERKAKLASIAEEGKTASTPANIIAKQKQVANLQFDNQRESEQIAFNQKLFGLDKQLLEDQEGAYRTYTEAINKINKEGVAERIKVLEKEFTEGKVSVDDYMSQRRMLIEEEYELTVDGLNKKAEAVKKNSKEEATIQVALIQAQIDREKQLTDLQLSEGEKRVKNLENNYNQAKKFLDVVTATAARGRGAGAAAEEETAQQAMLSIVQQRLAQLQIQQAALNPAVHGFSEEWTQVQEQIAAATEEEQKLNQQLAAAKDIAAPLAGIFGQIGALFEKFGGPTSRGIASMLTNMQGAFGELSKFSTGMAEAGGGAGLFGGLKESFTGLFKPQTITTTTKATAQQIFDQGLQKSSGTMDRLSEVTTKAISQIMAMGDAAKYVADTISRRSTAAAPPEMTSSAGPEGTPVSGTKGTYQFGTPYVPETGTYMLHAGEAVVPSADLAEGMGAPGGEIAGVISGVTESLTNFKTYLEDTTKVPFAQSLQDFAKGMGTVMSGLMGVVQGITGGKTAGAGAVSGATSLGGFGMQIGSIAGPMGALLGGGAGAAVGGILGGIFGGKEERLQVDLNTIKNQMEGILESLHTGTISLSQAIADLRQERQSAIAMLSQNPKSGKGGGKGKKGQTGQLSQAQAAIQAIDQQIQQLVDEQKAILDQLHQSLEMLSQPIAFQTYLSSLDQIIQKYQEFASAAAGNAQEVANAQLFLNDSLQQYVQTLAVQLNQAQQQAIQDGLTLLNLEYQRQQIINQSAQQEYDILTQGVAVRQRTTAMTKGQEIGQLQYQRDMQLEQINEQISLQKYKVESETKIFGLATTRIGLETQLLAAQESAFDVQNKQTAALAQVLTDLQQGMASGTLMKTITSLFSGGALPTGTGLLYTLLQQLGLGGNVPAGVLAGPSGTTNLLGLVPQQYQSAASFLNSLDPNFLSDLESAMQTPPGSAQRQSLLSSIQQYASQGAAEGYDMSGLGGWIASGAQQSGNIGAAGGSPAPPTAPITQPPVTSPTRGGGRTGLNPIRKAADFISTAQPPISVGGATNTGTQRLTVESQLLSITNQRVKVEMNVISARQDQINMEMEYLSALQDTYSTIASGTASGSSRSGGFEAMLQKVYETRGRYGSGNFRRETP